MAFSVISGKDQSLRVNCASVLEARMVVRNLRGLNPTKIETYACETWLALEDSELCFFGYEGKLCDLHRHSERVSLHLGYDAIPFKDNKNFGGVRVIAYFD